VEGQGHLFVFEGADGVGKSRRCRETAAFLQRMGVSHESFAFPGKQAGSLGFLVQTLQVRPEEFGLTPLSAVSVQALQIAVQLEVLERHIVPRLKKGHCVLIDRFWWSSWVYGTEMGANPKVLDALIEAGRLAWSNARPSAVFLIQRDRPLRVEQSPERFGALSTLYQKLASQESQAYPVYVISNGDFASAQQRIQNVVRKALNRQPGARNCEISRS